MSLRDAQIRATVAVSDIDRAAEFYEGVLGLESLGGESGMEGIRMYPCGKETSLQVYVSEQAGGNTATAASWSTDDFDSIIEDLIAKGVSFETSGGPQGDERGIHTFGEHKVVWFRDPDGNTLALDNGQSPA